MFYREIKFILAKDEARGKSQAYLNNCTENGYALWRVVDWDDDDNTDPIEPNSNKLSWKLTNPDKTHIDQIYVKVAKIIHHDFNEAAWNEVKGRWKIEIDGEQTDCTFDYNYEAEIKGEG